MKLKRLWMKPFWIVCVLHWDICRRRYNDPSFLAFHDDLDFVSVQEKLIEDFKAVAAPIRGKHTLDAQIENIAKAKASALTSTSPIAKTALLQVRWYPDYMIVR
jgi:hypothetical protein